MPKSLTLAPIPGEGGLGSADRGPAFSDSIQSLDQSCRRQRSGTRVGDFPETTAIPVLQRIDFFGAQ